MGAPAPSAGAARARPRGLRARPGALRRLPDRDDRHPGPGHRGGGCRHPRRAVRPGAVRGVRCPPSRGLRRRGQRPDRGALPAGDAPERRGRMTELSVLIPTWNAAGSIRRALDSVLTEHSIDLEFVVVDDGPTDAPKHVAAPIATADPRVVLLALPENGGVSKARNRGLEVV